MNDTATPTNESPPASAPTPGDPPPSPPSPRIIGGVCALLGDRLGVDPLWLRIGFVLLAMSGGLGLLVYGALWLALVQGPAKGSAALAVVGGILLVLGVPFALPLAVTGIWLDGPLALIIVLGAVAVALWQPQVPQRTPTPPMPRSVQPWEGEAPPPAWDAPTGTPSPPGRPPRPPSPLGALTVGVAIAVAAIGALIDEANGGRLHPEQWLGAAALVCGLGLVVGAFRGHARWLIIPALAFAGAGIGAASMAEYGIGASDLAGDRWVYADENTTGPIAEQVGIGNIYIEINEAPSEHLMIRARVAVGTISVNASDQVAVDVVRTHGGPPERIGDVEGPADVVVDARSRFGSVNVGWWSIDDGWLEDDPTIPSLPDGLGRLSSVHEGVGVTDDGWFVLGDGDAVIDDQNRIVIGEHYDESGDVTEIYTTWGDFRLLSRGLLITPGQEVLDLEAIRAETTTGVQQ